MLKDSFDRVSDVTKALVEVEKVIRIQKKHFGKSNAELTKWFEKYNKLSGEWKTLLDTLKIQK